jgi:hypothetical protein
MEQPGRRRSPFGDHVSPLLTDLYQITMVRLHPFLGVVLWDTWAVSLSFVACALSRFRNRVL